MNKSASKSTSSPQAITQAPASALENSAPTQLATAASEIDAPNSVPRELSKQDIVIRHLSHSSGTTINELVSATGWQKHSIRGMMSGTLKKKLGLTITSEIEPDRGRVYRLSDATAGAV